MTDVNTNTQQINSRLPWSQIVLLSDEELCRQLLRETPVLTGLDEMVKLVVERLVPGLVEKMGDEDTRPAATVPR